LSPNYVHARLYPIESRQEEYLGLHGWLPQFIEVDR
jgi:hypothetical protein